MTSTRPHSADRLHYAAVLLAFALSVVHFYLGFAVEPFGSAASVQFVLFGVVFLAGVGVYLTTYFRPVLYLVGSLYAAFLGVLWFTGGMRYLRLGLATGVLGGSFILLTAYLFVREERFGDD
ncbi:DUF7475 family protein [Candidatus Halobonum tyrrellensis]|uniref:Carbon starvation protein A n=1 Tax=Candidatus Halobonum tyrrellensis G22 TaxID=1324957 RepID=V4J3M6_9EURY|nr:hypothetical protein [Candidatus Halobonum tyrrellensis]ESP89987.1 carbon starvation protein A [Candidatus Halobonum tyrrellensis G22]